MESSLSSTRSCDIVEQGTNYRTQLKYEMRNYSHLQDDNIIHVGIIMKGVWQGYEKCHNLKYQFVTMIRSILQKSKRKNLHFVFLTDQKSVAYLDKILRKFIIKDFDDTTVSFFYFCFSKISSISHIVDNYL